MRESRLEMVRKLVFQNPENREKALFHRSSKNLVISKIFHFWSINLIFISNNLLETEAFEFE